MVTVCLFQCGGAGGVRCEPGLTGCSRDSHHAWRPQCEPGLTQVLTAGLGSRYVGGGSEFLGASDLHSSLCISSLNSATTVSSCLQHLGNSGLGAMVVERVCVCVCVCGTDRQTDRDRQTNKHTDRQTDRQTVCAHAPRSHVRP